MPHRSASRIRNCEHLVDRAWFGGLKLGGANAHRHLGRARVARQIRADATRKQLRARQVRFNSEHGEAVSADTADDIRAAEGCRERVRGANELALSSERITALE